MDTMAEIAVHKKDRDDAQKARIETALKVLNSKDIPLPAYPSKTKDSLIEQMNKQNVYSICSLIVLPKGNIN